MRIVLISLLILVGILPSGAKAGTEPITATAPDWVEKLQIPSANPKLSGQPIQSLLSTAQTSHSPYASTHFFESANKIQTAEMLTAAGTIAISWQPERSDLIIHKVEIIRDGDSRDILAAQKFSVLRRENYLEAAVLNGMLTATIQPEDLRVGDILHLAYSIREKPGSVRWKSEDSVSIQPGIKSGLVLVREIWADSIPLRWAASPGMGQLKARETKLANELRAEFRNIEVPLPPQSSPPRFATPMYLEVSAYRDWAEISALLAPLYAKAVSLPENSPLRAEARLIASASPAPKARALAALRLVQDKIRNLAIQMNEGGYIPASAEDTWNRRFGDCKGKTAALLALLKELGIEAEPILVNTTAGDMLPTRLPQANLFNHVLVHATIEGKSYWLDGTRQGDRDLEELASSSFRHGLPLRGPGAMLIELPFAPPLKPLTEMRVSNDASAGISLPAKTQGELIFRGEFATSMRLALAQIGEAEFTKRFEADRYIPGVKDRILRFQADATQEAFTVFFSGRVELDWSKKGEPPAPRFQFSNSLFRARPNFTGHEGVDAEVPFALNIPVHLMLREEVILPAEGKGYTLQGAGFDRRVGGVRMARSLTLDRGRAVATSTLITLQPELPAAEARASTAALAEISGDAAYIVAPAGLKISDTEVDSILSSEPKTADEFVERGFRRQDNRQPKEALADFDRAIELAPNSSVAHARRALALIALARLDEAEAAVVKAFSVPVTDPRSLLARGLLRARQGRPGEAIQDFSRYLAEYNPKSLMALYERALAYEKTGALEKSRADLQRMFILSPDAPARIVLARVTARLGNVDEAMAIADRITPRGNVATMLPWLKDYDLYLRRGMVLSMAGQAKPARAQYDAALREVDARLKQLPAPHGPVLDNEIVTLFMAKISILTLMARLPEAIALADQALAMQPYFVPILTLRCQVRLHVPDQLEKARQDCNAARRNGLNFPEALYASGLVSLRSKDWADAVSEFENLTKTAPGEPKYLFGRGIARLRQGQKADGGADIERAREMMPEVDFLFARFGISPESDPGAPQATAKAVPKLNRWSSSDEPATAEDFIARGYTRVEKQQLNDALSDFDHAVRLAPDSSLAHSLRALALIRLARLDEAEIAIGKALRLRPMEPKSFQVRGLLYARRGRPEDAIKDFSRNLEPDGASALWFVERGLAYERLGELEKARADLQQAVALAPAQRRRLLLARVTARLGDVKGAIAIVDNAVPGLGAANTPPWMKTYILALRRGRVLSMAGRKEEARAEYEAALAAVDARLKQLPAPRGPVLGGVALLKAKVDLLLLTERATEAIAIADQALAVQPSNASMLTVRCKAWLHASAQLAKARQDCDAARRNDPANRDALYVSGLTSLKSNDWVRAASEFQALTKELPSAPAALFGRGIAKLGRGEKADGGADIELARSLSAEIEAEFDEIGIRP